MKCSRRKYFLSNARVVGITNDKTKRKKLFFLNLLVVFFAGQKHRVCCYRRGLHPSTNLLAAATPSSSTPASTAPSECSSSLTASQLKKVVSSSSWEDTRLNLQMTRF